MGTRNGCHLCPTCGTQLHQGDLCCTLSMLGSGVAPLQEALGLRGDVGRWQRAQQDVLLSRAPLGGQPSISLMPVHLVQGTHLRLKIASSLKRNDITKGNGFNKRGFFSFFFLRAVRG